MIENAQLALLLIVIVVFLSTTVLASLDPFMVTFLIPGEFWTYYITINDPVVFSDQGNHTINSTVFLRQIEFPTVMHKNNSAVVTGTLTAPDDSVSHLSFDNLGNLGRYSVTRPFLQNGTYLLEAMAQNVTYGWATTESYIYVGKYDLNLSVSVSKGSFSPGEAGTITATVIDYEGNPQQKGHALINIIYPDGSILSNWTNMSYASGEFSEVFINPVMQGRYNITINFSQGVNSVSETASFWVTAAGAGGGGDGSRLPVKPYYDLEVRVDGNLFNPKSTINASIFIINMGDYPDRDATLKYYLVSPDGQQFEGNVIEAKEIDVGGTVYDITLEIPEGQGYGLWKVWASYETVNQPIIEAQDTFLVSSKWLNWAYITIALLVLIIISMYFYRRGKKRQKILSEVMGDE